MRSVIAIAALLLPVSANAEVFAVAGVKGDWKGRTVLTTDPCTLKLDSVQYGYSKATLGDMRRAFYYTSDGVTNEGCWRHDAGSVVLVWPTENILRRWPTKNFKIVSNRPSWN